MTLNFHINGLCWLAKSFHAWHKMQRIRPSWTVIALSGFAHERNKNPRWRRLGVKNIEQLRAFYLVLQDLRHTTSQHHRKTNSLRIATIDDVILHRIWPFWLILYHCIREF